MFSNIAAAARCKPMWKNRRKRLTNTPVTQSVAAEGDSIGRCHFDFPSGLDDNSLPVCGVETTSGVNMDAVDDGGRLDDAVNCDDDEFGFECIPLQTVCNEDDDDNDDIYFLVSML